jgi:dynein heavy chain
MKLLKHWTRFLRANNLLFSPDWTLQRILGDSLKIRTWNIQGLPADDLSIDNGIITTYPDSRWPLIIDPQTQGNRWIKNKEKDNSLKVIKLSTPKFLMTIETSIKMGFSVLLENIGETLDPSLEPVLQKNVYKKNNQLTLNLGGSEINYHNDFLFFMTTKLPNPHYLPEVCIKVTLLNFTVTPQGLEDQLLVEVIKVERPELEMQKDNNIISLADCNRQIKDTETRILKLVSEAGEDILEDEELILTLDQSKQTAITIGERKAEAEITAEKINVSREKYRPVARRGSVLYFVIANLALINDMYQYSLEFFTRLFKMRLEKSEQSEEIEKRISILIDDVTRSFYLAICRGLFERDKLLYSFLNTAQILMRAETITTDEWNIFLRGSVNDYRDKENDCSDYIDDKCWFALHGLQDACENFKGLIDSVKDIGDKPMWREIVNSEAPWEHEFPAVFQAKLTPFQRTMLYYVLKPTKLMGAIKEFVKLEMGAFYIESPPFDLEGSVEDSNNETPIIFVLSPGADPIAYLKALAVEKGMDKKLESISLGQG